MAGHSAQGVVRVSRKPKTASETEIVRLITATNESTPIGNFSQLVKDLESAGIVIGTNEVVIKGDKVKVLNGNDVAVMFEGGKLNANLINADTITVNHLYAKSGQNGSVVGHFGNYDKSDAVAGDDKCPLWLGATTAANAPFRVTKDGAMYAISGEIAGFKISNNSLGIDGKSQYGYTKTATYLRNGYFAFYDAGYITENNANEYKRQIILENSGGGGISIIAKDWTRQNLTKTGMLISLMNGVGNNVGLRIHVSGSKSTIDGDGDHAILIENGDIAGFRLNTKVVTTGYNVTNYDNIIVCKNTSQITVLLPIFPQKGQIFYIRQTNANVQIKCTGYKMYGDALSTEYSIISNKTNQMTVCTFDGSAWYVNYYNG